MNISYYHASKFGNGAAVAEEFKRQMAERGVSVSVCHVKRAAPKALPPADLYVFSSPGRLGKPIGDMRKFLKKAVLPPGAPYAVIATEFQPDPARRAEPESEPGKCQRIIPIMNETLQLKGLTKVVTDKIYVTGLKGPLETGWEDKVQDIVECLAGGFVIEREPKAAALVS
jgi:menaquinone-dependent protoporphyrinogen IX oxidase